jgi:hypothetical protein
MVVGALEKIAALLKAWVCVLALFGLQMCCNVRPVIEVFLLVWLSTNVLQGLQISTS